MNEKKYEMLKDYCAIKIDGHTLYKIRALKDFGDVHADDLGGYIETEDNLSQKGNCWAYDESMVYDGSELINNATLFNIAKVYGHSQITGDASIRNNAHVFGRSDIGGHSSITGNAKVHGGVRISGDVYVTDDANIECGTVLTGAINISDNAIIKRANISLSVSIGHNARILSNNDYFFMGPVFANQSSIFAYKNIDRSIVYKLINVSNYITDKNFKEDEFKEYLNSYFHPDDRTYAKWCETIDYVHNRLS